MDPSIIAAIIGAIATIAAVFIAWVLQRKKGDLPEVSPIPETDSGTKTEVEAKKYARRYLEYPSHYRFIWSLPKLKAVVLENAQQGWDTGVTADMREASYDVIDFLEYSWLRLAQFYPSEHWGGKDAEAYIRSYIQDRFTFHWSKHEPEGPGTGGTIVGVLTGSDVIEDLENLIVDTVSALFMYKDNFDFSTWKALWEGKVQQVHTADAQNARAADG
jgi:hypothetical protein